MKSRVVAATGGPVRRRVVASILLLAAAGAGQETTIPPATIVPMAGESFQGTLLAVDKDGVATIRTAEGERKVPLGQFREVRWHAVPLETRLPQRFVALRSGMLYPAELIGGQDKDARVRMLDGDEVLVPLRFVKSLRCTDKVVEADMDFAGAVTGKPPADDVVFVWASDKVQRIRCRVDGITGQGLRLFYGGENRTLPLERVYGLVMGEGSGAEPVKPPQTPRVTLRTRKGFEAKGLLVEQSADAGFVLRLDEGFRMHFPMVQVARVTIGSERLQYVSALKPIAVDQAAAFNRTWPVAVDRSLNGEPIRLGGTTYDSGLVMVPRTRMTFAIDGRFSQFVAEIGIGDEVRGLGDATFRVIGDGKELLVAEHVRSSEKPRSIKVDVRGVSRLMLEVDFGDNLDLGDHCVWADARLIKEGP